ncbi:MAG: clostripain-related cysteine peptidase [Elusimicrobiota bacterium]|nr:clostripain-related cysteine peptidase [Elusimicrobiota bacterium]
MFINIITVIFSVLSFAFPACSQSFDLDSIRADSLPAAEVPAVNGGAAVIAPAEPKEWTIMVYASVKDSLGGDQIQNLMALKRTGTTDRVNIVAESGFTFAVPGEEISTPTLRMLLTKSTSYSSLDSDTLSIEQSVDMGDWRRVAAFIAWAKTSYPAKRYVFVPFGHGNGFFDYKKNPKAEKSTLSDKQTHNYVTVPEFGRVLKETGRVDVLLYLSCLMQTAEAAYEVKDYVDVIVGSEELMSSIGYDMGLLAETLDSRPGVSSAELGSIMAKSYVDRVRAHPDKISGGQASVIFAPKLGEFSTRLDGWVKAALELKDEAAAVKARKEAARFDIFGITTVSTNTAQISLGSISGDLYDFVGIYTRNLPQDTPAQLLARRKGLELMEFISNEMLAGFYYTGTTRLGLDFARTHGISIHLPPARPLFASYQELEANTENSYSDFAFAKDGSWKQFMDWLYSIK